MSGFEIISDSVTVPSADMAQLPYRADIPTTSKTYTAPTGKVFINAIPGGFNADELSEDGTEFTRAFWHAAYDSSMGMADPGSRPHVLQLIAIDN